MLESLELVNYRNLNLAQKLDKANLIIAPNSSGKSNFLESIYFSNFARPYRTILNLTELIGENGEFAKATFKWSDEPTIKVIVSQTERVERRFEISDKRQKLGDMVGKHNVVLFAPTTLDLVAGEPSHRRADLDDYLSVCDHEYSKQLDSYKKVLLNRNSLLRMQSDGKYVVKELEHFSGLLAEHGDYLFNSRQRFFVEIAEMIDQIGHDLFSFKASHLKAIYRPNLLPVNENYRQTLLDKFKQNAAKEAAASTTLYGVHKDDYAFNFGENDLRYRGSRGQQRLASLTFKLAQLEYLQKLHSIPGIILLDDLMSELDLAHREACADYLLNSPHQFILTAAAEMDVPTSLIEQSTRINLKSKQSN